MKIDVDGKPVHINEYHFIHLMHKVGSIGVSNKKHTVILDPSYNIPSLRLAAQKSGGKPFKHDGCDWTWNGEAELVPSDGPNVVNLSGEEIEALRSYATLDVSPTASLMKGREFKEAYRTLEGITGSRNKKQETSDKDSLEIPFIPQLLPRNQVTFTPGKPKEGFLMGPHGSKEEYPHIHLFFEDSPTSFVSSSSSGKKKSRQDDEPESSPIEILSIKSAVATLSPTTVTGKNKRHMPVGRDGKIIINNQLGSRNDDAATISELEAAFAAMTTGVYEGSVTTTTTTTKKKSNNNNGNNNNNNSPSTSTSSSAASVQVSPPEPSTSENAIVLKRVAKACNMEYGQLLQALKDNELDPDEAVVDYGEGTLLTMFHT